MRVFIEIMILLGLGMLTGCARTGDPSRLASVGPHGGPLIALPGEAGYAEISLESTKATRGRVQAVAYFLDPNFAAALDSLPTEVSITIEFPDRDPVSANLAHQPKPGDATGAGRFATEPGPFAVEPLRGALSGVLNGQPFSERFRAAR